MSELLPAPFGPMIPQISPSPREAHSGERVYAGEGE